VTEVPAHTVADGAALMVTEGVGFTVTAKEEIVPLAQALTGVTETLPEVLPKVTVTAVLF